jgi:adenylosuccinate synthase
MMQGYADVLVGLQYGDEGKAKVVDWLAPDYDIVARFNGGANAGHTVVSERGTFKLAQIPSAVLHDQKLLYIGSGCAVNVVKLAAEIQSLTAAGIQLDGRLYISANASLIQPHHLVKDFVEGQLLGSTGNGIGPCYADRAMRMIGGARVGLRLEDLMRKRQLAVRSMNDSLVQALPRFDVKPAPWGTDELLRAWTTVSAYVVEDPQFLVRRVKSGARVLFEGAQSVQLDVGAGEQPFVTSSHTDPGYAYVGGDLSCRFHRKTIGIVKAIVSRVGAGTFRAEFGGSRSESYCAHAAANGIGRRHELETFDPLKLLKSSDGFDVGIALRMLTNEYGTGTGRPRRVGMLDIPQLRDTIERYGVDEVFINKVDCLTHFEASASGTIPIVSDCRNGSDVTIATLPAFGKSGIEDAIAGKPSAPLKHFLDFARANLGCEIRALGVGPKRTDTLSLEAIT